jgi:hypothetical protein
MSEKPEVLVWMHGDSLSPNDPAACAFPHADRVFVFDRPLLEALRPSFKRLFFIHECAEEVAHEIRLGDPAEELLEACQTRGLCRIAVTRSHSARFREVLGRLRDVVAVDLYDPVELVSVPDEYVPRRFGEFWRKFGKEWH